MAVPYYTHSGMVGAPQFSTAARSTPDVLAAVLVDGFNVQAPTGGTASGGVLTLNFGSSHGYEELCHITLSGASVAEANGVWRVTSVPASDQLTVAIPGLADGAVGGTMSTKVAPAGWTEPFTADTTTRVFQQGGGNQRYLRMRRAASALTSARGFEAMTGLDTGTELFPTLAQVAGEGVSLFGSSSVTATHSWWALASGAGVYFQLFNSANNPVGMMYFGEPAEPVKASDSYSTILLNSPTGGWMARSHDAVAGALTLAASTSTLSLAIPSPIANGLRFLAGVPVVAPNSSGVCRGLLPGAFLVFPPIAAASAGTLITSAVGISGRVRSLHGSSSGVHAVAVDEDWGI
jgi:hypothetical protein